MLKTYIIGLLITCLFIIIITILLITETNLSTISIIIINLLILLCGIFLTKIVNNNIEKKDNFKKIQDYVNKFNFPNTLPKLDNIIYGKGITDIINFTNINFNDINFNKNQLIYQKNKLKRPLYNNDEEFLINIFDKNTKYKKNKICETESISDEFIFKHKFKPILGEIKKGNIKRVKIKLPYSILNISENNKIEDLDLQELEWENGDFKIENVSIDLYISNEYIDNKWFIENNNFLENLNIDEILLFRYYTGEGYDIINRFLRDLQNQDNYENFKKLEFDKIKFDKKIFDLINHSIKINIIYQLYNIIITRLLLIFKKTNNNCIKIIKNIIDNKFIDIYIDNNSDFQRKSLEITVEGNILCEQIINIKNKKSENYNILKEYFNHFSRTFWIYIIYDYANKLKDIINKSPKLNQPLIVYRGIKNDTYLAENTDSNYICNMPGYLSTSLEIETAYEEFSNKEDKCCIQRILILPGNSCLFLGGIGILGGELEILIPMDSIIYIPPNNTKYLYISEDECPDEDTKMKIIDMVVISQNIY